MKKIILLLAVISMLMMSGCASNSVDIDVLERIKEKVTPCESCTEKVADTTCTKEIKVIIYTDRCKHNCGFPVTVRKKSTCKDGRGM